MNVRYFEGAAGTGKTFRLVGEVAARLEQEPLAEGQRVLGLTFMHGARQRLEERLCKSTGGRRQVACQTVDSFAWHLIRRWRRKAARILGSGAIEDLGFDRTCDLAADLLEEAAVLEWVKRGYPVLVVDEMQDCKGGRLRIVQQLATGLELFAAADGFQDLDDMSAENGALEWLRLVGERVELGQNFRTDRDGILRAAESVRAGTGVEEGRGFRVKAVPSADVAATLIAYELRGRSSGDVVILSPSGPRPRDFVGKVIARLRDRPITLKKVGVDVGPFPVNWEASSTERTGAANAELCLNDENCDNLEIGALPAAATDPIARMVVEWAVRQGRVRGVSEIRAKELREQVGKCESALRQVRRVRRRLRAMSIHQAKNQEFTRVVVLWPHRVAGSDESLRRRFYNGITRAMDGVLVLVEGKEERLRGAPFSMNVVGREQEKKKTSRKKGSRKK